MNQSMISNGESGMPGYILVAAVAALAWLVWRGIAALFPDLAWLQGPRG